MRAPSLDARSGTITPVDLATSEIYDILRKRLFASLPDKAVIGDVAAAYGRKLEEAAKAKTAGRGAEAIADHIAHTYPFHPELKHVIALFKENEQFKQTRGLIELISRLLKSVWERSANDVFLIGPAALRPEHPCRARQADRNLSHARRHRQGPMGRAELGPRAAHRPRSGQAMPATQVGSLLFTRQPVHGGERCQGTDP